MISGPKRRDVILGAGALLAAPAVLRAQTAPVQVKLDTIQGTIVIDLASDKAPKTSANFLRYVDAKKYDGANFYRALHPPLVATQGMIQGGINGTNQSPFPGVEHEPTTLTGLTHTDGVISLARNEPGSGTSEFFICVGDETFLDADPSQPGDNLGYAAFGHVSQGMDIVRRILLLPANAPAPIPAMEGQMLTERIKIFTARRV